MKILVIQLSRFGDLLQTTPMLCALRRRYPHASITVLSRYNVMEIYKDNPDVDYVELFSIEAYTNKLIEGPEDILSYYVELRDAVARLKSMKFDLVLNTTHDRFCTFLAYLLAAPEIKGMYLSAAKRLRILINGFWFKYLRCTSNFREIASFNLADIYKNAVGGDMALRNLFFHTPDGPLLEAEHLLNRNSIDNKRNYYIGFQLGTSTGNRRWPLKYFAALGNMLHQDKRAQVVLLGNSDEKGMGEKLAGLMEVKPLDFIGRTNLSVLAAILKKCVLLVTNDTGTMHLAEAVGTRCVALFFESANPFQTGPYGAGHIICAPELDCFPCPTTFKCEDKKCLDVITVDTVYRLIRHKLDENTAKTIHPTGGVRIYETRFVKTGTWDAWPMEKARLNKNDLARRIFRSMWLQYAQKAGEVFFEGKEGELQAALTGELKEWAGCYVIEKQFIQDWLEDFSVSLDMLEENMNTGITLLEEIVTACSAVPFNQDAVTAKSDDVGVLDQQIIQAGESNIWLSQITNLFELELEQIQDSNFFVMLTAWKQTYNAMKLRVDLLKKEIQVANELLVKGRD